MDENALLRPMTDEERRAYLRHLLWAAQYRLMHLTPKCPGPGTRLDRALQVDSRNEDVALVLTLYELFPDERRKLTPDDLTIIPPDYCLTSAFQASSE